MIATSTDELDEIYETDFSKKNMQLLGFNINDYHCLK